MEPATCGLWPASPRDWVESVRPHLDQLLVEQAHLEKMAAAGAVALLFRMRPGREVHRQLSALAREELVHFERTLRLLGQRDVIYEPQQSSGYAERLKAHVRRDAAGRLCDELLVAAVIEARSHERMSALGQGLGGHEPEVAAFYLELCAAEERHAELYLQFASEAVGAAAAELRHGELLRAEADVLRRLPWSPRLHGGLPPEQRDG